MTDPVVVPQTPVTQVESLSGVSNIAIGNISVDSVMLNGVDGGSSSVFNADVQALQAATGLKTATAQATALDTFFSSFNSTTNPVPQDLETFVQDFVNFTQTLTPPPTTSPTQEANNIYTGFLTAYETNITGQSDPSWASLPIADFAIDKSDPTSSPMFSQLSAAWSTFAANYPYTSPGGVVGSSLTATTAPITTNFFQMWRNFTSVTAVVNTATATTQFDSGSNTTVPSYEAAFNATFPSLATTGSNAVDPNTGVTYFQEALTAFYQSQVTQNGYFNPSQDFSTFVATIQAQAGVLTPNSIRLPTTSTDILDTILHLIIGMIGTIQNAAAAQANRLTLYTDWQQAYTSILGQVHVFTEQSSDYLASGFGAPQSTLARIRQDVQGTFNTQLTQKITSYQDTITNDAKSLQSNVNQSSQNFNQQSSSATAILQELSTILTSIFQS